MMKLMKNITCIFMLSLSFLAAQNTLSLEDNNDGTWNVNYTSNEAIGGFQLLVDGVTTVQGAGGAAGGTLITFTTGLPVAATNYAYVVGALGAGAAAGTGQNGAAGAATTLAINSISAGGGGYSTGGQTYSQAAGGTCTGGQSGSTLLITGGNGGTGGGGTATDEPPTAISGGASYWGGGASAGHSTDGGDASITTYGAGGGGGDQDAGTDATHCVPVGKPGGALYLSAAGATGVANNVPGTGGGRL